MPENVLFDPKKVPMANNSVAAPVTSTQPAPVQPVSGFRQDQSWLTPPPPVPPPPPRPRSSLGLLLKLGLGVLLLVIVLGIILFVVLPNINKQNQGHVTLVYWGLWDDKSIMQPIIDSFEQQHPNITIDYQLQDIKSLYNENQEYPKRLVARINSGGGPDIFRYHNNWYPELAGVLAPMSQSVVSTKDFTSAYFPVVSQDLVHQGAIYGIPLDFDTLSLYINPEIFQKAGVKIPSDWNDVQVDAPQLTVKGSDGSITTSGIALGSLQNINNGTDILGLLLSESNVDYTNISANQAGAQSALNFFMQFTNSSNATWSSTLPNSLQMFSAGNLAMYIGYSWDIANIQRLNPNLHFQIYPMPSDLGVKRTIASYWVEGVSIHSQHMQEAMEFMNFLNQKTTQQEFYASAAKVRGYGEPYARSDLAATLKSNSLIYPFEVQGPTAVSTIFNDNTFDNGLNDKSNSYLKQAVNGLAANGSLSDAVNVLSNGVTQVLQQYGQ